MQKAIFYDSLIPKLGTYNWDSAYVNFFHLHKKSHNLTPFLMNISSIYAVLKKISKEEICLF